LELKHVPQLNYIEAYIRETLRYQGPISSIQLMPKEDTVIGGKYAVAKGKPIRPIWLDYTMTPRYGAMMLMCPARKDFWTVVSKRCHVMLGNPSGMAGGLALVGHLLSRRWSWWQRSYCSAFRLKWQIRVTIYI
jgi:hypothetical protein